jgi:hypothetical protein
MGRIVFIFQVCRGADTMILSTGDAPDKQYRGEALYRGHCVADDGRTHVGFS